MKSKNFWYGFVIALTILAGVVTGVGLGRYYVANASVEDYSAHTSDSSGNFDYFTSSDNWLVSLGWANNSSVSNFTALTYTGNTLYYQTKFYLSVAGEGYQNPNVFLWGANLTGSTDNPTATSVTNSSFSVYNLTSSYGVYATQVLGWNFASNVDYSYYTSLVGLRFHSSQNTNRYNVVYFQARCYDSSSTHPNMSFNIGSVEMGNYTYCPYADTNTTTNVTAGYYNWISYLDLEGLYRYTFFVSTFYDSSNTYANSPFNYFSYRRYILQNESLSDNAYYQQGLAEGYEHGKNDGYNIGYDEGHDSGYSSGDSAGYQRGLDDANQFTFFNLLGSVVDAPISAFRGLFNFSILGINMADFLASLLTLCIIFLVVKFVFLK